MKKGSWLHTTASFWAMGIEASTVIAMRTLKLAAGGPGANREAHRMVNEKIKANIDLCAKAMTGGLGATPHAVAQKTVSHYRTKVKANQRRLKGQ